MSITATPSGAPEATPAGAAPGSTPGAALAWLSLLLVLVARGTRALLVTLVIVSCIPLVSSWSGSVVRSGSMEPGMSVGDVIIAQPRQVGDAIPVGRVMVFDNPDRSSQHATMIHRVVSNLGNGQYATAGDANRAFDTTPAAKEDFTARPVISVPFIALPLTWWADRDLGPLIVWLTLISALLYFSVRPPCDPRHRRRREASKARRAAEKAAAGLRRVSLVLVPTCLVVAAVIASPFSPADAAFTDRTVSHGNTWTAAKNLAKPIVAGALPAAVRGTVPVTAVFNDSYGTGYSVRFEYAAAGATSWTSICTDTSSPYACSWVTTAMTSGTYDVRAVATSAISGAKTYTSDPVRTIVDNTAPSTTMQDTGSPLKGIVTTTATASDAHSGVAQVVIQYAPSGSTTFKDICTDTTAPYSCSLDTTTTADGTYTFRSVATDVAGTSTTSTTVTGRVIDNSYATVSVDDLGAYVAGTVAFRATAAASAGVTSVRVQYAPSGSTTWTTLCTDTATPYGCSVNTTTFADGLYDVRAIMLDGSGRSTTSAVVTTRIDNNPIRAFDVQTANGGFFAGRLENRDSMTMTYSERVNLNGILSGWTGTGTAVTVRIRDGALLGQSSSTDDTITVLRNGAAVNLGSVDLGGNYMSTGSTADFAATMTASTTTVNGVTATVVTLTMGAQVSGTTPSNVSTSSTMTWTPSASVVDLNGRPVSSTPATELGSADREF
jgi:signal peptidase I